MLLEAIRDLDDAALSWLGWMSLQDGPETPRAEAPLLWMWIEAAAAHEQARRAGAEGLEPPFPVMTPEQTYEAARSAVAFHHAQKIGPRMAAAYGYEPTPEALRIWAQWEALFRTASKLLLAMAGSGTLH